jgi:plasmid stabilization system protein ParE
MQERWTRRAEGDFDAIIEHLLKNWTAKEALAFIERTRKTIDLIKRFPGIGADSERFPNLKRTPIVKQVTLFYEVDRDLIHIVALWNNRMNPDELLL